MISSFGLEQILKDRGFTSAAADKRRYAHGYRHAAVTHPLYVKANIKNGKAVPVKRNPLVVHPYGTIPSKSVATMTGVHLADGPYHNSNLAGFPTRDNGGKKEIAHGRAIQFSDEAAVHAFLDALVS